MPLQKQLSLAPERYENFKSELACCDWFFRPEWSLFALAPGGHVAATFDAVALNPEIRVIWRGSQLPLWARPFGVVVAAYGGIVCVTGTGGLRAVCDSLLCMSVVEFLVVHREAELTIGRELASLGRHARARHIMERKRGDVVGVIFSDDDAHGDYPITYQFADGVTCPVLKKYEEPERP